MNNEICGFIKEGLGIDENDIGKDVFIVENMTPGQSCRSLLFENILPCGDRYTFSRLRGGARRERLSVVYVQEDYKLSKFLLVRQHNKKVPNYELRCPHSASYTYI